MSTNANPPGDTRPDPARGADVEDRAVAIEHLRIVLRVTPVTMIGAGLAGLGLALVLWDNADHGGLLAWLAVLATVSLARAVNAWAFLRHPDPAQVFERAERLAFLGWTVTCLLFGICGGLFIDPKEQWSSSLALMIAIGFAAAGSGAPLFIRRWGGLAIGLILVPSSASIMVNLGLLGVLGGLLVGVFVVLMSAAANRHLDTTRDSIRFRLMSERRAASLEEALRAAEEASRAKTFFLSNMSHELRTPINAIGNYAALVSERAADIGDAEIIADTARINVAANHLLLLVNDVLDLSKVEAGYLTLLWETIDLAEFLCGVEAIAAPVASQNDNRFAIRIGEGLGTFETDTTRLRQCLLNLVSNAGKFTRAGEVTLTASRVAEVVTFVVTDTGIGMSDEQIARLFQPFSQADLSTTKRYGGTGLGLYLTRELTRALGGAIAITSAPGLGTTFSLTFPARRASAPEVRPGA